MPSQRPRLRLIRGPRLAEDLLFEDIQRLRGTASGLTKETARLIARPIRVLVPSHSLRLHLNHQLIIRFGPVLGVSIQTLHRAAEEVLERAGEQTAGGGALFDVLVRRIAQEDPILSRNLTHLEDGFASVAGSIRELLDAGLDAFSKEALIDALANAESSGRISSLHRQRAEALLAVAVSCLQEMEAQDVQRPASLMSKAAPLIRDNPDLLPSTAVYLIGFGEAPGLTIDFIEALTKAFGQSQSPISLYLDTPPDPAEPTLPDPSARITERLQERLASLTQTEQPPLSADPPAIEIFTAPGVVAEVREAAFRVRKLLDENIPPESIGIVARELAPYRNTLRTQLYRLGVPWSGVSEPGPPNAQVRLARALLDLLRDREDAGVDRWLGALVTLPPKPGFGPLFSQRLKLARHDLRVALRVVGASRVVEVAGIRIKEVAPDGKLALPVRRGMEARDDDAEEDLPESDVEESPEENSEESPLESLKASLKAPVVSDPMLEGIFDPSTLSTEEQALLKQITEESTQSQVEPQAASSTDAKVETPAPPKPQLGGAYVSRRYYPADKLERVISVARTIWDHLRDWYDEANAEGGAPIRRHVDLLAQLLDELGWMRTSPGVPEVQAALLRVDWGIPSDLRLSMEEFVLLAGRALERVMPHKLGGEGGGVQLLSVPEARERTFKHLFVLGLNRDQFPRNVKEDPLLPDAIRRAIQEILPDLPLKLRGYDEERYFFASLLSASAHITLSYQIVDEDGNARPLSPLLERVKLAGALEAFKAPPLIPGVLPDQLEDRIRLRPAMEHAILAGIHADRSWFKAVLQVALSEVGAPNPEKLAAVRTAILDEMDPDRRTPDGWQRSYLPGPYLGFIGPVQEAADPRREVPHLTLLENIAACGWQVMLLRVMRLEEVPDPTLALPAFERQLIGTVVHQTLEEIVRASFAEASKVFPENFAAAAEAVEIPWPDTDRLVALARQVASEVMRNRGVGIPGFDQVLADHGLPILELVRRQDWQDKSGIRMLGVELSGEVPLVDLEGNPRKLPFIADRVDEGWLLTEYKTGKTISEAIRETTRRNHLAKKMSSGEKLQAIAYILAASAQGAKDPEGRFVFVGPRTPDHAREFKVNMQDTALIQTFERIARATLDAWDKGTLLPRVVEANENKEPSRCQWCSVAAACSRRDSGTRSRINRINELWTSMPPQNPFEASWYRLWRLRLGEVV